MMPALLLATRNCTLRPCWPPADSVNACVASSDCAAITTQGPKFSLPWQDAERLAREAKGPVELVMIGSSPSAGRYSIRDGSRRERNATVDFERARHQILCCGCNASLVIIASPLLLRWCP
jgi:hypothetical protein